MTKNDIMNLDWEEIRDDTITIVGLVFLGLPAVLILSPIWVPLALYRYLEARVEARKKAE